MIKDTGPIDAASILLILTDYCVITVTQKPAGRQVLVEPLATEAACPSCGVLTTRIQGRPVRSDSRTFQPAGATCRCWYVNASWPAMSLPVNDVRSCKPPNFCPSAHGSPPDSPNNWWTR